MVPDRAPMDYPTLTRIADLIEDGLVRGVKNAHWCSAAIASPLLGSKKCGLRVSTRFDPVAGLDRTAKAHQQV